MYIRDFDTDDQSGKPYLVGTRGLGVAERYATKEEADAQVSYLNGGLHPTLAEFAMKVLAEQFKEALIDPRALKTAQCVHGVLFTDPCEICAKFDDTPPPSSGPMV